MHPKTSSILDLLATPGTVRRLIGRAGDRLLARDAPPTDWWEALQIAIPQGTISVLDQLQANGWADIGVIFQEIIDARADYGPRADVGARHAAVDILATCGVDKPFAERVCTQIWNGNNPTEREAALAFACTLLGASALSRQNLVCEVIEGFADGGST